MYFNFKDVADKSVKIEQMQHQHGHILDVDQPRYEDDFSIDWVKLGYAVKRRVKKVKDMIVYNDDRADLAQMIETYGPASIDLLHGEFIVFAKVSLLSHIEYCWCILRVGDHDDVYTR